MSEIISRKEALKIRNAAYYERNKDRKKAYVAARRKSHPDAYARQLESNRKYQRRRYWENLEAERARHAERERKKADLIHVLKAEMPDLLKEFGL